MPTITRLRIADRRAARTIVQIDGEDWATLDSEVVLKHGLMKGQEISQDEMNALHREDAFIRCRRIGAGLLATRPRATEELRRRLREYQPAPPRKKRRQGESEEDPAERTKPLMPPRFDNETIGSVVEYFADKGDLNDLDFARRFIRHNMKLKSVGRLKIRNQLMILGVPEKVVEEAIFEELADKEDDEEKAIQKFIERRLPRMRRETPQRRREKMDNALFRAGFDPDKYRSLLLEALGKMEEDFEL